MPSAEKLVTYDYDPSVGWQTKATPAMLFESISIVTIFVAPSLGAAMNITEGHLVNQITKEGILWNDSSIVSNNSGVLPLVMKNAPPTSLL